jgi:ribosomal protein S18 acetylase RimI-like enzyme
MAARNQAPPMAYPTQVVDLRYVSARQMEPLLAEESGAWRDRLDWDFEKSADLVRRFVDLRALSGCALIEEGAVAGYAYFVLEEHKGLVGDLFVRAASRTVERENRMLRWVLDAILAAPSIRRVESQLMMIDPSPGRVLPMASVLRTFERNFMVARLAAAPLGEGRPRRPMYLERWSEHYQDAAAQLIAAAYAGHVDAQINDQYRTPEGARRFLYNIVQYPGCGTFYRPASCAAFEAASGRMCGMSLASLVGPGAGHITQICVSPEMRGAGLGHMLLRQSMKTLRDFGCHSVSLTVTASNTEAIALYERMGFRTTQRFSAYVWEGF